MSEFGQRLAARHLEAAVEHVLEAVRERERSAEAARLRPFAAGGDEGVCGAGRERCGSEHDQEWDEFSR